jgi:hypothetical protein
LDLRLLAMTVPRVDKCGYCIKPDELICYLTFNNYIQPIDN